MVQPGERSLKIKQTCEQYCEQQFSSQTDRKIERHSDNRQIESIMWPYSMEKYCNKDKKKKSRLIYKRQWRIIQTPWPQITQPTSIMLIWLHKTTSSWEMTTLSKGLLRFDWKWYFVSDTDLNTSVETNHKLPEQEIKRIPECLKCHKDKTCVCILQISPVESFEFSNTNCIINWNYNLA